MNAPNLKATWIDSKRWPQNPGNPAYPDGIDLPCPYPAKPSCRMDLPYPAKRIGHYVIECSTCGLSVVVTTAGRDDDPRSVAVNCLPRQAEGKRLMPTPEHPYSAIVAGLPVYGGDDLAEAMRLFEAAADQAAIDAGAEMVVYVATPFAPGHMVPGNEARPVVEAHAMARSGRRFVGALYGVSQKQWRSRAARTAPAPSRFECPECGFVSHNPNDLQQRYCGRCHAFVDDRLSSVAAYVCGYGANKMGEPRTVNPHRPGRRTQASWDQGWQDARDGVDPNIGGPENLSRVRPQ